MHTEGMVIFSDSHVYDSRRKRDESWKFKASVELLNPDGAESTTSSLLELLSPIDIGNEKVFTLTADQLCELLFVDEREWTTLARNLVQSNPQAGIDENFVAAAFRKRYKLLSAIESYLMANRGTQSLEEFKVTVDSLATSTLAFHLATDEQKIGIKTLFFGVASFLDRQEPMIGKQAAYSKTLLGISDAKAIESWVEIARTDLLALDSNEAWLDRVWGLFQQQSDDKFFHAVEPAPLSRQLALMWLNGCPYKAIYIHAKRENGTKPWGETQRRKLTEDEIMSFCENTLGFDCALVLAAVAQFLFGEGNANDEEKVPLTVFQKSLKYGLPDEHTISCYEIGFTDRVLAQHLCSVVRGDGFQGRFFSAAIVTHRDRILTSLQNYPSYFGTVLTT